MIAVTAALAAAAVAAAIIWNQAHLRRILRQYETHHNQHRPHRSLNSAAPLKPLPEPVDLSSTASEDTLASVA